MPSAQVELEQANFKARITYNHGSCRALINNFVLLEWNFDKKNEATE